MGKVISGGAARSPRIQKFYPDYFQDQELSGSIGPSKPGDPEPKAKKGELQRDASGKAPTVELEGVTISPPKNKAYMEYQGDDYSKPKPNEFIDLPTREYPHTKVPTEVKGGYEQKTYVKSFNKSNPLSNYDAGSSPQRKNALNELNEFMSKPTSSPRQVTQKLKDLKSSSSNKLSDIKYYDRSNQK